MAVVADIGNADRNDQQVACETGSIICQRSMGEYSLPDYGPVISLNRPVRTRMPGGVGRAGEKPALTRFGDFCRLFFYEK